MFSLNAFKISIDQVKYAAVLNAHMENVLQQAAQTWLNATVVRLIPIWSGASAATFLHLAREANFNGLTINPVRHSARDGINRGLSQSGPSNPINVVKGKTYTFSYNTTLKHLIFNESNDANSGGDPKVFSRLINPGPYNFQEAGKSAFNSFAGSVSLPNPFVNLVTKPVRTR